jgi:hypothetical protein
VCVNERWEPSKETIRDARGAFIIEVESDFWFVDDLIFFVCQSERAGASRA